MKYWVLCSILLLLVTSSYGQKDIKNQDKKSDVPKGEEVNTRLFGGLVSGLVNAATDILSPHRPHQHHHPHIQQPHHPHIQQPHHPHIQQPHHPHIQQPHHPQVHGGGKGKKNRKNGKCPKNRKNCIGTIHPHGINYCERHKQCSSLEKCCNDACAPGGKTCQKIIFDIDPHIPGHGSHGHGSSGIHPNLPGFSINLPGGGSIGIGNHPQNVPNHGHFGGHNPHGNFGGHNPNGNFNRPPHHGNFNRPPHHGNFNRPPHHGNFNRPPPHGNTGNFNRPPHHGNFNRPPHHGNNGNFNRPPHHGNFNRPPHNGNFNRPPHHGNNQNNGFGSGNFGGSLGNGGGGSVIPEAFVRSKIPKPAKEETDKKAST